MAHRFIYASLGTVAIAIMTLPALANAHSDKLSNNFAAKAKMAKHDALLIATEKHDLTAMKALLASGSNPNHAIEGNGTALIIAARHGDMKAVKILLKAGADINLASPGDGAPLIVAASNGHKDIVVYLLDKGADVAKSSPGDGNALIKAATGNHVEIAKILLAAGAKVDAIVPADETALINAAQSGHLEMVKFLVEDAGADISLGMIANPDHHPQWRSPLSEARRMKHKDVVAYLETKGAIERRG